MTTVPTKQHNTLAAEACTFAVRAHAGQERKGSGFPYIVHPIGVAHLLRSYYPEDEYLEAAGYLHDVVEDTAITYSELTERFGPVVSYLVDAVTRKPGWSLADWTHRPDVLRLKAADMLDNIRDTQRGIEKGHDVWSRFAAGRRKAESWRKDMETIYRNLPHEQISLDLTYAVRRIDRCGDGYHSMPHKGCILR